MNAGTNNEHARFNQAKREILNLINSLGETTALEISVITGRSPECASMNLLTYHGQGLLSRRTLKGRTKVYTLTQRGRERLRWLEAD